MIMKIKFCGNFQKLISCVFSCQCARCSDPTELGTHMWDLTTLSSVQCSLWMLWQNLFDQGRQSDAKRRNVQGWPALPFPSPPHQPGTASAVQLSFLHSRFCTEIFKLHILSVVFIISKFSDWKVDGEYRRWPGGLCHHKRSSSSWRNDPQAGIAVVKPQNLLI